MTRIAWNGDSARRTNRVGTDSKAEVKELTRPNRYSLRAEGLTPAQLEKVRGGGWDLPLLQKVVDEFVIHYDVCGTSKQCFNMLQDHRDLSVHFLLDVDGTIYQTLDLKERALHASDANTRSVGVEIANMGAYPTGATNPLRIGIQNERTDDADDSEAFWRRRRADNRIYRTSGARRSDLGTVNGQELVQYDFTPQQYAALAKLTAALCRVLPRIECKYPVDAAGKLIEGKLPDKALKNYHGVLGHYHLTTAKVDPARRLTGNG